MKNELYSQDIQFIIQISNINSILTLKFVKKVHMTDSCIKISYHKSTFKTSNYKKYSILISIIKYIEINNLISLILIQSLFFIAVNALDSDFIKLITSKILDYYQDLFEIFFKKESESLSSHRDHLNHHISLKKNVKLIFDFIYNLFELEFKILKEYIQDKLKKELIHSFISLFNFLILFIKKFDNNLHFYIDYRALNRMIIKNRYFISLIIKIIN